VRQVHEQIAGARETGYTATLKLMQIMTEKGLLSGDERARTHIYAARVSEAHTQGQLVADLLERAFGGSAAALVQRALSTHRASSEGLIEIRKLIEWYQEERR
jgi:BlaI family transcriptional regulator, penicillinase repressor